MVMEDRFGAMLYQHSLQAIGIYLDRHQLSECLLCEVGDGFIARGRKTSGDSETFEGLGFAPDDLRELARSATEADTVPDGYAVLFACLGSQLDRANAQDVTISEIPTGLLVCFYPRGTQGCYENRHEFLYDADGLRTLLKSKDS